MIHENPPLRIRDARRRVAGLDIYDRPRRDRSLVRRVRYRKSTPVAIQVQEKNRCARVCVVCMRIDHCVPLSNTILFPLVLSPFLRFLRCVCVCVCVLPKTVRRFARCRPIRPTMIPTFYRSRLNDNHRGHPPNRRCNRARGAPEPPQAP